MSVDQLLAANQRLVGRRESAPAAVSHLAPRPSKHQPRRDRWSDEIGSTIDELDRADRDVADFRSTLLPAGEMVQVELAPIEPPIAPVHIAGGAARWFVYFRVIDGEPYAGRTILGSYNPPSGPFLSRNHALYADWLAIVGRPLRSLPRRYTARSLLGAFLRGVVVTASTRQVGRMRPDPRRDPRTWLDLADDDPRRYSVIDRLISLSAGTPPVLDRRRRG